MGKIWVKYYLYFKKKNKFTEMFDAVHHQPKASVFDVTGPLLQLQLAASILHTVCGGEVKSGVFVELKISVPR